jgi:hypothetical protein
VRIKFVVRFVGIHEFSGNVEMNDIPADETTLVEEDLWGRICRDCYEKEAEKMLEELAR